MRDPASADGSTAARIRAAWSLLWNPHPPSFVVVVTGAVILGLTPIGTAWLAKLVVDSLADGQRTSVWLAVALLVLLLIGQLGQAWLHYVQEQLANRMEITAQSTLFSALNRQPGLALFERPGFHDRIQVAQQASQIAPTQLVQLAAGSVQGVTSLVGLLTLLTTISPLITALAAVAVIPHLVVELGLSRSQVELHHTLSPAQRRKLFYARLQSEPQAAREVRLFGLGRFFHDRMLGELQTILHTERTLARKVLRRQATLDALTAVATGTGVALVISWAAGGRATPGDVTVVLAALPGLGLALTGLIRQVAQGSEALLLVERLEALATMPTPQAIGTGTVGPLRSGLVVEDVWFRYADHLPWVLRGVSFKIPAGSSVGLVGVNGAGKSTLVKLLTRLYEPTRGRISWDGTDIRELDIDALRQRTAVVLQDFMTYDLSAAENIGLGDLARLEDLVAVRKSAGLAGVDPFVRTWPRGYDTMLSRTHGDDDGQLPSGGQWQRIALARMLMRADRDLLILDEPSSALDPEAEADLHELVHRLTAGATRVLISHRLNAVRAADRIIVLADGVVSEQGGHDELIAMRSRYAELFHRQAAGYRG